MQSPRWMLSCIRAIEKIKLHQQGEELILVEFQFNFIGSFDDLPDFIHFICSLVDSFIYLLFNYSTHQFIYLLFNIGTF